MGGVIAIVRFVRWEPQRLQSRKCGRRVGAPDFSRGSDAFRHRDNGVSPLQDISVREQTFRPVTRKTGSEFDEVLNSLSPVVCEEE
jgi:hypothetical protein